MNSRRAEGPMLALSFVCFFVLLVVLAVGSAYGPSWLNAICRILAGLGFFLARKPFNELGGPVMEAWAIIVSFILVGAGIAVL